jgi:Peptidase A4 family
VTAHRVLRVSVTRRAGLRWRSGSASFLGTLTAILVSLLFLTSATGGSGSHPSGISPLTSPNYFPRGTDFLSGYAALNSTGNDSFTVTQVEGTWTQPSVNCSNHSGIVEMWVGIDGVGPAIINTASLIQSWNSTVERTGTYAQCWAGSATYFMWWQLLPTTVLHRIPSITLHPGDKISASVTYVGATGNYSLRIADGNRSFTQQATEPGTNRTSAECILDRPSANHSLANFGETKFTSCMATISGVSEPINGFGVLIGLDMYNRLRDKPVAIANYPEVNGCTDGCFNESWSAYY